MFKCKECGYISSKWLGKCPQCGAWDSFEETTSSEGAERFLGGKVKKGEYGKSEIFNLKEVRDQTRLKKISTGLQELDRVLSGGVLKGGVLLLGGEPGIGKSTLFLQVLGNLASQGYKVLYASSEESLQQVYFRAKRILPVDTLSTFDVAADINLEKVMEGLKEKEYDFVVFDSIQGFVLPYIDGVAGGIAQTRSVSSMITNFAKTSNTGVFLVGQVTKTGNVAGPKTVEHMVDTVLYMEYLGVEGVRMIRAVKNRFGAVGDAGFIKMLESGFVDAPDAEALFIQDSEVDLPGAAFGVVMYGSRPLVVQVQVLLNDSAFAAPRRVVEGVSKSKIEVLAAVVNQRVPKVNVSFKDLFVKILGGITLKDAGIDLAIVAAMVSAFTGKVFKNTAFVGEVDLLGNVKPAIATDFRLKEAKRLGFKRLISHKNLKHIADLVSL